MNNNAQPGNEPGNSAQPGQSRTVSDKLGPYLLTGLAFVLLLFAGIGGWAATAEIAGAVLAEGTVVVDSNVKKVQHPTGGVVSRILVKDGDAVTADQLLIQLDETVSKARLALISGQLQALEIRKARLMAERDDARRITFPHQSQYLAHRANIREFVDSETSLFKSRLVLRAGRRSQFQKQIEQLQEEVDGIQAQRRAKMEEMDLIGRELANLYRLKEKRLVPSIKITELARARARLRGQHAQLGATVAKTAGKISELQLKSIEIDHKLKTEVTAELREVQSTMAELEQKRVAATDELERVAIRSPTDGIVHQLGVHTVGGVVEGGDAMMLVVPQGDELVIEAKLPPSHIDDVEQGQSAYIRLSAFNQRTTPQVVGTVSRIAPELSADQRTGRKWFSVRLAVPINELDRVGALKLKPGMPAEVQIRTRYRTALSYLARPLVEHVSRSFKEE